MARELEPLVLNRKTVGIPADNLCGYSRSLCQQGSQTFSFTDLFNHLEHAVCIAELQIDSIGVFPGKYALFVTFHSPGNA